MIILNREDITLCSYSSKIELKNLINNNCKFWQIYKNRNKMISKYSYINDSKFCKYLISTHNKSEFNKYIDKLDLPCYRKKSSNQ
ncbi:MAG: hypothetical protein GY830_09690 [Bacteroidetes bacterium]|nr:hypothetical protein [Bacteroidota bacterium]